MTKQQQQELAADLARNFAQSYLEIARHSPEYWTGFELRQLLVDVAQHRFVIDMDKDRARQYRSDLAAMPL